MPACLRSVKFFRVCVQCSSVVLASIEFLSKYVIVHSAVLGQIPSHRARLSALGQIISCYRAMMHSFVEYRIPQLKYDDVFFGSRKLAKPAQKLEAHKTFYLVMKRSTTINLNTLESGSCTIRGQANWGPYPSIAMSTEADQKLSSRGECRLTRVGEQVGDWRVRLYLVASEYLETTQHHGRRRSRSRGDGFLSEILR